MEKVTYEKRSLWPVCQVALGSEYHTTRIPELVWGPQAKK